jgi:hypothetical protein
MDTMNLEIDLADRSQLIRLRNELRRHLGVVEFAIKESQKNDDNATQELLMPLPAQFSHTRDGVKSTDNKVKRIIDSLPSRFNSTDVFLKFGEEAKIRRGAIKLSLKRALQDNKIRVLIPGKGRRPTKFERVL